jgi:hypothetical protein
MFASISCEKDTNDNEIKSEQFKLLTAHIWNFDTITTICKDPEIQWFINLIDSSFSGGTVYYGTNGDFILTIGDGEVVESGKWKFSNAETEIISFDEDDPSDIYGHGRIDLLTENSLIVTDLVDVPPSDTCYVTGKWVK